jgi:3-hydroxyisobutyrate dehydrogenase-like beta-hydroxyacid dehydrogenase
MYSDSMPRVALIGLGRMGRPMAAALLGAGFPLTVYNRTPRELPGARIASSPAEAAARADVLITMVSDAAAAREVLAGVDRRGLIVCEMSTIGPAAARELSAQLAQRGIAMLDAPVSGSVASAQAGTLTVIAGGPRDAFERARPVLGAFSKSQIWLGPSGAGAAMKLALNGMIAASAQMLAEALAVAERSDIAREDAYDAIAASAVGSPFVAYKRDAFLDEATPPAFSVELMLKDLALALEQAGALGVPLDGVAAAAALMGRARARFGDDADIASVAAELRHAAATRDAASPHTTPEAA